MRANCNGTRKAAGRPKTRTLARTYVIQVKNEATAPSVTNGINSSPFNIIIQVLIDPDLACSYNCTALVIEKSILVKLTEYEVRIMNLLSQCVINSNFYIMC